MKFIYILFIFSILATSASALVIRDDEIIEDTEEHDKTKKGKVKKSKINFRASFSTSFSTDFKKFEDSDKSFTNSSGLRFYLYLPHSWSISTALFFDKNFTGERKTTVRDTYISVSKTAVRFNKNLWLTTKLNLYIPISESSREITYLNTAYRFATILGFSLGGLGLPNIGGYARADFIQNFHRSNTNAYESSNSQFRLLGLWGFYWTFWEKFYLSIDFNYGKSWTYEGTIQDSFGSYQGIFYSITNDFSIGLGHALGGNILAVNGRDSNIAFFDSNQSVAFLSFDFNF